MKIPEGLKKKLDAFWEETQDIGYGNVPVGAEWMFKQLTPVIEALKLCEQKGHHDTCYAELSTEFGCDCGYSKAHKALEDLEKNEEMK